MTATSLTTWNPLPTVAAARELAAREAASAIAIGLRGELRDGRAVWTWTFLGENSTAVEIEATPDRLHVVVVEQRRYLRAPEPLDLGRAAALDARDRPILEATLSMHAASGSPVWTLEFQR